MKETNILKGRYGEEIAVKFLCDKGYDILKRNYRAVRGEIDIIAQNNGYVVFVEVKYREQIKYGYPSESVTTAKCANIRQVAKHYILCEYGHEVDSRFDVIEILNRGKLEINHLEGAF